MYDTIEDKLAYLVNTKDLIKNAINNQGQNITNNTPFREYANLITNITPTSNLEPVIQNQSNLISNLYDEINTLQNIINNKSVEYDWQSIGYESAPKQIETAINVSKNIYNIWNNSTTSMYHMFYENLNIVYFPNVNTSSVQNLSGAFFNCYSMVYVPNLDFNNVNNMYQAFTRCYGLTDLPPFLGGNIVNLSEAFRGSTALTNLPIMNITDKAKNFGAFCWYCYNLSNVDSCRDWIVSNVTNMMQMFGNCYNLVNIDISNWQGNNVVNVRQMFQGCNNLTDASIQSIVQFLLNCPNLTSAKNLRVTNIDSPFKGSNVVNTKYQTYWSDLTNAGWTY